MARERKEWVRQQREANRKRIEAGEGRVYGHSVGPNLARGSTIKDIEKAIANVKERRREEKLAIQKELYRERAKFGPEDTRKELEAKFAYGVKDKAQLGILESGKPLGGRFMLPNHPAFGSRKRSVMDASGRERAELGFEVPPDSEAGFGPHTIDSMLYTHQEFGSGDRQRGVSLSTSPAPLLSNEARGFARLDDPGARKMQIDLAKVPRPRRPKKGRRDPPNLINFAQRIPGFEHAQLYTPPIHRVDSDTMQQTGVDYPQHQNQERWDWSTGKNREMFLRELKPEYISSKREVSTLDRLSYYNPKTGKINTNIPKEIERVKKSFRDDEAAVIAEEAKMPVRARQNKQGRGKKHGGMPRNLGPRKERGKKPDKKAPRYRF